MDRWSHSKYTKADAVCENAKAFILQYRVLKRVIVHKGEVHWQAGGAGHYNVRRDFEKTGTGVVPKNLEAPP